MIGKSLQISQSYKVGTISIFYKTEVYLYTRFRFYLFVYRDLDCLNQGTTYMPKQPTTWDK